VIFRKPAREGPPLTPLKVKWLGALLLAAQIPQAPHLPIWVAAAGLMLVSVRLLLLRRDPRRPDAPPARIPSWALALFAVATALALRQSYGYLVGRDPSVAFLYVLVAIKFLETRTARDGMLLVCLACFLTMTPFFYSQSLFAALAALPAVVLVGATLDVLSTKDEAKRVFAPRAAIQRSAVMMMQGLPIAVLLFVFFPRLAQPLWGLPADHSAKTGLSDSMMPGEITELSLSDSVAFRVAFDGPVPPNRDRYWRGPVFSRFDGRRWSPSLIGTSTTVPPVSGPSVGYTVTIEPNNRRWLFALDLPASIPRTPGLQDASSLVASIGPDMQVLVSKPVTETLQYVQRSVLRASYPQRSAADRTFNLELGRGNERTIEFARQLRDANPEPRAFIAALLGKFHDEEYVYTLAPPYYESNPIDMFMFDGRRGFCEHFASAFVLILRAGGIPARIVTGYQGGTINPRGGYMIVRQSDAHAWAEALIDGQWQRFDPTAAVSPSRIEIGLGGALPAADLPFLARLDANWLTNVQLAWDAFNYDWRRNVVGFNRDRQRSLFRDWRLDDFAPWQAVFVVALMVFAWGALVVGWLMWKRRHQERALVLWDDLNRRLASAGLPRHPYEGPLDFAKRAAARWPQFAIAFSAIGESFAELRYGAIDLTRDREALVATLQRAIEVLPAPATLRSTPA
jgi:transglutaminase-like putative cysteine protease